MQKVEIILNGPEAEKCAAFIMDLAKVAMGRFDAVPVRTYCGKEPVKAGYGELLIQDFMQSGQQPGERWQDSAGGRHHMKTEYIGLPQALAAMHGISHIAGFSADRLIEDARKLSESTTMTQAEVIYSMVEELAAAQAVRDGTEKFVRCDECRACCQPLKDGSYFCNKFEGMHGRLYPERGDGRSHGQRITERT
ncbi:MAG: hypothetical protein NC305_13425 [Lachnospiraceae bacterium]|nr:hypothetical protein [Butyrivibrio sp.]MCM1344001.1 hypothetical protein [Muribaculaceae bacterium]MCM1411532.1 hypothetical protein [Lachnospiraceae bacterium]